VLQTVLTCSQIARSQFANISYQKSRWNRLKNRKRLGNHLLSACTYASSQSHRSWVTATTGPLHGLRHNAGLHTALHQSPAYTPRQHTPNLQPCCSTRWLHCDIRVQTVTASITTACKPLANHVPSMRPVCAVTCGLRLAWLMACTMPSSASDDVWLVATRTILPWLARHRPLVAWWCAPLPRTEFR
jgi:hypothetical protein